MERPEILPQNYLYYEAFYILHNQRSAGFNVNPISMVDMMAYMLTFGVENKETFIRRIQICDRIVLENIVKEQKSKNIGKKR